MCSGNLAPATKRECEREYAKVLAGTFLHAATKSRDEQHVLGEKPISPFLGFTESVIIMGSVVALFAAFVAIQFQYFFGG